MKIINLLSLTTLILISSAALAETKEYSLKKNQVFKDGNNLCILVSNKWTSGKKSGKKYIVNTKASTENKELCKSLLKPSKTVSLTKLPSSESIVKASSVSSDIKNSAVSGTPPTIAEIISAGADSVFWRSGVISSVASGSPTQGQCTEFFGSSVDGESGGFAACYMTENVGYSISEIARAGTSMCYMKNFPTADLQSAGAVELKSGTLPGGKISQIFDVPAGSEPRIVKVVSAFEEGEQIIFIKVASSSQNASQGNQYKFDIWFCEGNSGEPQEYEQTTITSGGEYLANSVHSFGGNGRATSLVRGFLRKEGSGLVFDTSRSRTAEFGSINEDPQFASNFKSLVEVNAENEIFSKVSEVRPDFIRKGYSISRFTGSGLSDLRFFEGANKEQNGDFNFNASTEFRDSFYASSPGSSYATRLNEVSFESDSFYNSSVSIPTLGEGSCSTKADIELTIDFSHPGMQQVAQACEGERFDGDSSRFCQSEQLGNAYNRWPSVCSN